MFSYSGDEYWSLVTVCNCDKANNLDKDLLKQKMTCRWKPWREEVDEAESDVKKTSEASIDGESKINRALRKEVRKLAEMVSKLEAEDKRQKEEKKKKCSKCLLANCNGGERCSANTKRCYWCGELGHYSKSTRFK